MRGKNTILINGSYYDAVTGLPVAFDTPGSAPNQNPHARSIDGMAGAPKKILKPEVVRSIAAHHKPHKTAKSMTLRRDLVKKPATPAVAPARTRERAIVPKSPAVSRFASHPMALRPTESISKAQLHPKSSSVNHTVSRVHQTVAKRAPESRPALSSRELKEKLIAEKLAQANSHTETLKKEQKSGRTTPRLMSIMSASFAVIVLAGYLTYINMPNLSMRVAASQAGVNARFPDYHPSGYSFNGPIAYNNGEVSLKFASNSGNQNYVIRQKNSNWDSQAVLDNYVAKESSQYMTSSEQGLTIYTYKNKAAWVNGGVLYTIEGNAPLSNEQVLRIAGSM